MGNIGRPSQGCILCRSRRIKCDQRKPHCLKCEKSQRVCPGYKNPEKWLFMPQYSNVDQKTAASLKDDNVLPPCKQPARDSAQSISTDYPSDMLCTALPGDIETRTICLFMKTFVIDDTADENPGHLDFLPELYTRSSHHSCLRRVVAAVSYRNFINRCHTPQLNQRTVKAYVEALQSTKEVLANPVEAMLDETIATVHLLGIYELLTPAFVPQSWRTHVRGTLQLLRMRGLDQLRTSRGKQLFRLVHTPILLTAMRTGQEPAQESITMVQAIQTKSSPANMFPALVSKFFYHVTMLRARASKAVKQLKPTICTHSRQALLEQLFGIMNHGRCLHELYDFETAAEANFHWRILRTTSGSDGPYIDRSDRARVRPALYYFKSLNVMAHWTKAWTAQLYLNEAIGDAIRAVVISLTDGLRASNMELLITLEDLQSRAQSSAQNTLACVDFAFGDMDNHGHKLERSSSEIAASSVGPLYLLYGLETILESTLTSEKQKVLAKNALQRIGTEWGIMRA